MRDRWLQKCAAVLLLTLPLLLARLPTHQQHPGGTHTISVLAGTHLSSLFAGSALGLGCALCATTTLLVCICMPARFCVHAGKCRYGVRASHDCVSLSTLFVPYSKSTMLRWIHRFFLPLSLLVAFDPYAFVTC